MKPILEQSELGQISPDLLDMRLVTGWRHFGPRFFRYNLALHAGVLCGVMPLRLRIERFAPSKSQRRVGRKNADLTTRVAPTVHCPEYDRLFELHRSRFTENVPESLRDFLSAHPADLPCANFALEVRLAEELIAVSFFDLGEESASSVYAAFDPAHEERSLGIFTLLLEIEHARRLGRRFHYLGYAYTVPSVYDYKKHFAGVEGYDWEQRWMPLPADFTWWRPLEAAEA